MSMNRNEVATNLVREELWSAELKEVLLDQLKAQPYVRWLTDFPDGDQLTIPSIGEATVRDFTDDTAVVYDPLDTGEFNFAITEYKQSGTYITRQAQQDSFYSAQLESSFVPKQARALFENLESDIMGIAGAGGGIGGSGQTVSDGNAINNADHRLIASGAVPSGAGANDHTLAFADFAKALYALKKANVSDQSLVAFVDPSVEYTINNTSTIIQSGNQPVDQSLASALENSVGTGMRFVRNIFGFDIYCTNYLAAAGAGGVGGSETIGSDSITNGKVNIFFSAADASVMPFIGAWRQAPIVDSEFNKDKQRTEYITTARYGLKLYRPENLVTVLSSSNVIF